MRFLKAVLPNICISLSLALLVVALLNEFNPRMGFLQGRTALVLICLCCISAMICSAALYASWRREK